MAARRVSRLQKRIMKVLMAEYRRTWGGTRLGHVELVKTVGHDKSNISHSLHTLEAQGWIVIDRTQGGQANTVHLSPEGEEKASKICEEL